MTRRTVRTPLEGWGRLLQISYPRSMPMVEDCGIHTSVHRMRKRPCFGELIVTKIGGQYGQKEIVA
jgi:hypothetical protein